MYYKMYFKANTKNVRTRMTTFIKKKKSDYQTNIDNIEYLQILQNIFYQN